MYRTAVSDLVGRVLAGRYRLLAPIGAGASGRVYVAQDARLRRRVAIKVLHQPLADDPGFLRRFRTEAQLAASLHHPHIVAVYDWGEDDGLAFMVLELLQGGSVRALLDAGGRLTPAQAGHVGRQVAQALQHAHARGLVHRDIKSSNLLFDEHAIVRVADFGLARALAEASWTEPEGAVVGTARYAAPEQARGGPLDGRADLYALAVVLVEAVTGTVPNVGETPVATMTARAREPLFVPASLGPLQPVLARAGQPAPGDRYPDAAAMAAALAEATSRLPAPEPLVLPGLGDGVDDAEPTRVGRPRPERSSSGGGAPGTVDDRTRPAVFDQDAPELEDAPSLVIRRRRIVPGTYRLVPLVVGIVVVLAIVAAAGIAATSLMVTHSVPAPSLVGSTVRDAAAKVAAAGLTVDIVRRDADDPKGLVIAQVPGPGAYVTDGATVRLVVSRGPPPVEVPDVADQPIDTARRSLEAAGFVVRLQRRYDDHIARDRAVATEPPAGEAAPPESVITLVVSDGPTPVTIPDVSGTSYEDAVKALTARGFQTTRREDFSDAVDTGKVVGTDPPSGQSLQPGGQVTVIVSKGPELVSVPNVVGQSVESASQALRAVGLQPDVSNYGPGARVRAQDPVGGSRVKKGSKVTLFL